MYDMKIMTLPFWFDPYLNVFILHHIFDMTSILGNSDVVSITLSITEMHIFSGLFLISEWIALFKSCTLVDIHCSYGITEKRSSEL